MKFEWEVIHEHRPKENTIYITHRAKVVGGWVLHRAMGRPGVGHESMVYIPDHRHEWKIQPDEVLDILIKDLDLTCRSMRCLAAENINTINDLVNLTKLDMRKIPNLGKKSIKEIEDVLATHNLKFKGEK